MIVSWFKPPMPGNSTDVDSSRSVLPSDGITEPLAQNGGSGVNTTSLCDDSTACPPITRRPLGKPGMDDA
jgi:hypothetical protein